jgi:transcriptional regulator with XRE-family HTH domain
MNYLREKRESLGLTLQEVSDKIGVHQTTISSWEISNKKPRPKNRIKLSTAYNCSINDLFNDNTNEENTEIEENAESIIPFAKYFGELQLGNNNVDCYVLNTGERVISFRSMLKSIADRDGGNLAEYIGINGLKPYINSELVLAETIEFSIPGIQYLGKGMKAESFIDICNAYVSAFSDGTLTTDRQQQIALKCSVLLSSCAKIGLIALIDEATGYQFERKEDALQLKLKVFIAEEMRGWEKTFPDELWEQFGRLTNWQGHLHSRPKWWGKLVMELIYNALDSNVATYLKEHKPPPMYKRNYHQWLSDNYGLKQLITHIYQIIGISKTCNTIKELQEKVSQHFSNNKLIERNV